MIKKKLYRLKNFLKGNECYYSYDIKVQKTKLGNASNNWVICPSYINSESIVYSFGAGLDISFDLELTKKFGAKIYLFDPTPKSIQFIKNQNLGPEFIFREVGIANYTGNARFYLPLNPEYVSATLEILDNSQGFVEVKVERLSDLMQYNNHHSIDLLKMDIEGAEYDVIDDILDSGIPVHQLLVEFHHRFPKTGIKRTRSTIQKLRKAGFALFNVSASGEELSFINRKFKV